MLLLMHPKCFPESSVVSSFLAREVDMKVSLARTPLVNEPFRYGGTKAICCSPIGHNNKKLSFARSGASIRFNFCEWCGESTRGLFRPCSSRVFSWPDRLTMALRGCSFFFFYVLFYILTYKSIFLSPEFLKREQTRQFACKFNLKPNYGTKVWPIGSESAKLNVCFVFDITWIPVCISGQESKVLTVNNQTETHFRQIYLATSTSSSAKWDALTNVLLSQISPLFWSYCPTFFNVLCKILLQSKCLARAIFWLPK